MSKTRRHFPDTVKAETVRRHLAGRVPVSDLAEELGVQPSLVHLYIGLNASAVISCGPKGFHWLRGTSECV